LDEDAKEKKLLPRNCCAKKLVIHRIGLEIKIFFVMRFQKKGMILFQDVWFLILFIKSIIIMLFISGFL